MIEGFNFIYLAKLGASRSLLGLTLSVTTIADVPVLHFLGKVGYQPRDSFQMCLCSSSWERYGT